MEDSTGLPLERAPPFGGEKTGLLTGISLRKEKVGGEVPNTNAGFAETVPSEAFWDASAVPGTERPDVVVAPLLSFFFLDLEGDSTFGGANTGILVAGRSPKVKAGREWPNT